MKKSSASRKPHREIRKHSKPRALLSVVASTCLLLLLRFNPRIFLGHYPKEIRKIVPPRSKKERWMSILFVLLIGVPFTSALLWRTATLGTHSFWELFAYAFGVRFIFNLVDLLILDWLIVCRFKLRWVVPPARSRDAHTLPPSVQGVLDGNRRVSDCWSCHRSGPEYSVLHHTAARRPARTRSVMRIAAFRVLEPCNWRCILLP